ncbi:MAG: hypothetical protein QM658_02465 [Gordonia sp. (in: high G+C Gram-positive bacteria)]
MNIADLAGTVSTVLFASSSLPMLGKALRTRDMRSYSFGNLLLANIANAIYAVYVVSLPAGPVWALHGFNGLVAATMLAWFVRFEVRARLGSSAPGRGSGCPRSHAASAETAPATSRNSLAHRVGRA